VNKKVEIKFDKACYEEYVFLQERVEQGIKSRGKPTYEQLLNSINKTLENLKNNPTYGVLVPRKYLSKKVITKYGTDKIFRVELIGYWRLLYTLIGDEIKIIAFILEYLNHDDYNKLFEYKKN